MSKSSTKISLESAREAQRAVLAGSRYPSGLKDAQGSAMFVGSDQLRAEVEFEGDTSCRKSGNKPGGVMPGGKDVKSTGADRGKVGVSGSEVGGQPIGPVLTAEREAPDTPESAGPLNPGRTKGLAGFWSNQNDDVKGAKKKRFIADDGVDEEGIEARGGVVFESTPQIREGVVRANDPGQWNKPLELEPGKTKNIASSFQQCQKVPPPTAKKPVKPVNADVKLGNTNVKPVNTDDQSADKQPKIKVKDMSEKLVRQASSDQRQRIEAGSGRAETFGDVIVLAENVPEDLSADIVRAEVQAKDEPVFEAGRTKNLLQHWMNTEVEYNAPKTSVSRLERGEKPTWIAEIEEAKGIKVENVGLSEEQQSEGTAALTHDQLYQQHQQQLQHQHQQLKINKSKQQLQQNQSQQLQAQNQLHQTQQQRPIDARVRQVGVVEPSLKPGSYDDCLDAYRHVSSSSYSSQSAASPAPAAHVAHADPAPTPSTAPFAAPHAAPRTFAPSALAPVDQWSSDPVTSASQPNSSSHRATTESNTSKELDLAEDMIRGILDDLDRQTAELDEQIFSKPAQTSSSHPIQTSSDQLYNPVQTSSDHVFSNPVHTSSDYPIQTSYGTHTSFNPSPRASKQQKHLDISDLTLQEYQAPPTQHDAVSRDQPVTSYDATGVTNSNRRLEEWERDSGRVSRTSDDKEREVEMRHRQADIQADRSSETPSGTDKHKAEGKGKKGGKGDKASCSMM